MRLSLRLEPGFVALGCGLLLVSPVLPWLLGLCAAVHELGHLLALQWLGVEAAELRLGLGGAVIDCRALSRRELALAALAGPGMNLLWALPLLRLAPAAALLSLGMAAFNLLPIPPLDGGAALTAALPRAGRPLGALALGALLALCLALRPRLGLWPLGLWLWATLRALAENVLVKCRRTG